MSTFCGAMVRLNKILIFGFSKMDKVELSSTLSILGGEAERIC